MTNKLEISREQAADSLYLTMWPNDTLHECEAGNPKWNACLKAVDAGYAKAAPVVDENAHLPHKVESLSDFLSRGTPEPSNKCGRCGASTVEGCNYLGCHFLESGNGAPVVERQVAIYEVRIQEEAGEPDESPFFTDYVNKAGAENYKAHHERVTVTPLYAEQPAPVAVPDGWKLVPIEPTAEMLSAAERKEWPADWEAGKRLQRLRGLDVVSPRTETECAVGLYGRILEAAPEYDGKVKELNQ